MIYIASPYSDPDKSLVNYRVKVVCQYAAHLFKLGFTCTSPILVGTAIFQHAELPSDFEFWEKMSYDTLKRCDLLAVIKLPGWESSVGVQAEITFAKKNRIIIEHVDVNYLMEHNIISKF